jgi:hypothetical protein
MLGPLKTVIHGCVIIDGAPHAFRLLNLLILCYRIIKIFKMSFVKSGMASAQQKRKISKSSC